MLFALAACGRSEPPTVPVGVKLGKPYEVNGKTYYPEPDNSYDETGDASWYGPGFHGKRTASGERFDENDITAAHPTLPMPSLVRVTNLQNDESVIVRINDRGPFHSNRIIDLSKKSAQLIGIKSTKPVRVQYLKKETDDFMAAFRAGDTSKMDMAEINRLDKEKPEEIQIAQGQIAENNGFLGNAPADINTETTDATPALQTIEASDLSAPSPASNGQKNIMPLNPEANSPSKKTAKPQQIAEAKQTIKTQDNVLKIPENKSIKTVAGKYVVVAGAFSVEDNAKKLAKKIADAGNVVIDKLSTNGKNMWRVQLVGFSEIGKAQKALDFIHKAGVADAKIFSK